MANQQLVDYIKSQIAAGVAKPEIDKAVNAAGWTPADKDAAFAVVEGRAPMVPPAPMPPKPVVPVQPAAMSQSTPMTAQVPVQRMPMQPIQPVRPAASQSDPGPSMRMKTVRGPVRWWFWAVLLGLVLIILGVVFMMPSLRDTIFNSIFPLPAPTPVIDITPEPQPEASTTLPVATTTLPVATSTATSSAH